MRIIGRCLLPRGCRQRALRSEPLDVLELEAVREQFAVDLVDFTNALL
jgi:hypothetical protein